MKKLGERFYQDVRETERRYHGRWNINMLAAVRCLSDMFQKVHLGEKGARINFTRTTKKLMITVISMNDRNYYRETVIFCVNSM